MNTKDLSRFPASVTSHVEAEFMTNKFLDKTRDMTLVKSRMVELLNRSTVSVSEMTKKNYIRIMNGFGSYTQLTVWINNMYFAGCGMSMSKVTRKRNY